MISSRIAKLEKQCAERGKSKPSSHFQKDYHASALTLFKDCPQWEKTARAMAYAIVNQEAVVLPGDTIGGRVYHINEQPVERSTPTSITARKPGRASWSSIPKPKSCGPIS